MNNYIPAKILY